MRSTGFRASLFLAAALAAAVECHAQNAVTDWNTIASATIVARGGKPSTASGVWFAYTSIAVYDAVNAIHGRFEPFYYDGAAPRGASDAAAAAAAAHRILVTYFPAQRATLDAELDTSLAKIVASAQAKTDGVAVGQAAADVLIAARAGDGLEANVPYNHGSGPGDWQPTPPRFSAPLTPWLGQMRPFSMTGPAQFLPDGPTPLASHRWTRDYEEVRRLGAIDSASRTPEQSEIGLFWTEHTGQQYARAFGRLAERYQLDVLASSRLMGLLWTGYADSLIGCFNAKYTYGFWRPVTAIRAGGGNPDLTADPGWTPLAVMPSHPEYPAAHGCATGAVSRLIEDYFGTPKVHVVVDSLALSDGVHTHTFDDTRALFSEVFRARIYAGFHYRHSLRDGGAMGARIARQLFHTRFRPRGGEQSGDDDEDE